MFDIRKNLVIDDKIQQMLFKLQEKLCCKSEADTIRRAIVEYYYKNFNN